MRPRYETKTLEKTGFLEKNRKKKKTPKPKNTLSLERVLIPNINHHMNIHVIDDISNIPPALFYHKQTNGIYIRLHNNNVFKIPFPSVVDSRKDYSRNQSIRCKYKTRDEEQVKKIDEMKRDTRKAEESSKKSKSAMEDF